MPDERGFPTQREIASLPRWARVVLALRCARRAQPHIGYYWSDSGEYIPMIDRALTTTESFARGYGRADPLLTKDVLASADAVAAARDAAVAEGRSMGYAHGMHAVVSAVAAAVAAVGTVRNDLVHGMDSPSARVAMDEAEAVAGYHREVPLAAAATWRDYEVLKALAVSERWTDDSAVDPDLLGPLWPAGAPRGPLGDEPRRARRASALKLQFAVPHGMSDAESRAFNAKVADVLTALSRFDAAMGGTGLQVLDDRSSEPVEVEDEEPVFTGADNGGVCS